MKDTLLDAIILKTAAGITSFSAIVADFFVRGATLPFFGVSITTLGMAAAGSMIAFAYGTPVESRRKLFGYAIGGTFIGVWAVQILPKWLAWEWYLPVMEPPLAGAVALLSRWLVPFVVEHIPDLWRRIFNTGGKTPPGG